MKKKIQWTELTKLPAQSTIFNNRESLTVEDLDHLRLLHIQEESKIKKAEQSLEKRKSGHLDYLDLFKLVEMGFSRVVDCESLTITDESGTYVEPDHQEEEMITEGGNSKKM